MNECAAFLSYRSSMHCIDSSKKCCIVLLFLSVIWATGKYKPICHTVYNLQHK